MTPEQEISAEMARHDFAGYITIENCPAVLARINKFLEGGEFSIVVSKRGDLVPVVLTHCVEPSDTPVALDATKVPDQGKEASFSMVYGKSFCLPRGTKRFHCDGQRFYFWTDTHDGCSPDRRSTTPWIVFSPNIFMIQALVETGAGLQETCWVFSR
jgi:hypothetical protein